MPGSPAATGQTSSAQLVSVFHGMSLVHRVDYDSEICHSRRQTVAHGQITHIT